VGDVTIYGWDMSHFDAPSIGSALAEGISFITHKAGGDSSGGDSELAAWWSGVKGISSARVLLGTYWVPRPDLYSSPVGEAARWVGVLDARCPGWRDRPFILQMDAERWPAGNQTKPSRWYLQSLGDRLKELAPKLRPICYASAGQYGNTLAGLTFPLWNARYPSSATGGFKALYVRVGGDSGAGWGSYSGQAPAIWQYTSSATIGGQSTSDANAYRGTLTQLVALVAPGWAQERIIMDAADVVAIRAAIQAELGEFFAVGRQPAEKGALPESKIGHDAMSQGIPDTINGGSARAYELIGDIGALTREIAAKLDVPVSAILAAVDNVDDQVLASLADAGRSDQEVADALRVALGDRAARVGALLAG
jgi:hypothetical protein